MEHSGWVWSNMLRFRLILFHFHSLPTYSCIPLSFLVYFLKTLRESPTLFTFMPFHFMIWGPSCKILFSDPPSPYIRGHFMSNTVPRSYQSIYPWSLHVKYCSQILPVHISVVTSCQILFPDPVRGHWQGSLWEDPLPSIPLLTPGASGRGSYFNSFWDFMVPSSHVVFSHLCVHPITLTALVVSLTTPTKYIARNAQMPFHNYKKVTPKPVNNIIQVITSLWSISARISPVKDLNSN